jgi:ADP-heptose:LPS heptosyltransferase
MQASSVFAGLKKQGFHVTVFTAAPGCMVIENDPNIDNMVVFDKDQVPNANLTDFWRWHKRKFTRWVNLSESAEGTLLAMPGRTLHFWPTKVRHLMMNFNYVELQHALADVPHELNVKFFATDEEKAWAAKERKKIGGSRVILWSLAGSAVHKTWAGLDSVLASFMIHYPDFRVVLTGGPECAILETGWENEERIVKTSGKWSIRQTLAFMQLADLVIGPETGVMNAACCEPMPKLVFLSHSSRENLTRDWVNTYPLYPVKTPCYPCHMLHFNWDHCTQDKASGTAQCQADISVEHVWERIEEALK